MISDRYLIRNILLGSATLLSAVSCIKQEPAGLPPDKMDAQELKQTESQESLVNMQNRAMRGPIINLPESDASVVTDNSNSGSGDSTNKSESTQPDNEATTETEPDERGEPSTDGP